MVATGSSEALVRIYQTPMRHIPEVRNFYIPRRDNREFHLDGICMETITVCNNSPVCVGYTPICKVPSIPYCDYDKWMAGNTGMLWFPHNFC
jgi:hypothetical protein